MRVPWRFRVREKKRKRSPEGQQIARAAMPSPAPKPARPVVDDSLVPRDFVPAKRHSPHEKRHHTERFRAPFESKWPIEKGAMIGFLTGLGLSSHEIEKELADGTTAATIRAQWRRARLPMELVGGPKHRRMPIALKTRERVRAEKQAAGQGLPVEEFLRRIIVIAARDDMYDAIVGDRFDQKRRVKVLSAR